ncbi:hypothetical protein KNP57_04645 [Latilactobacillus curvatus]|uniref:hypothetical protein n=1 Tax=Latilactobacillus curvatus TaxID=28038 RepID=UPI0024107246|nr:hypothetical protein [Latilactobacillus curvatus]MDG2983082.1 hypothetical protein [Latilactobacillus curvatus]
MDGIFDGFVTVISSASDAIAIAFDGYTTSEQERIDKLMVIFDDQELCKMIVRIESGKRNIGLAEIKKFNAKLQEME